MYTATVSSSGDTNPARPAIYSTIFLLICLGLPFYVQAETEDATIKQLTKKLEQRDAIINDLLQRVEQLERRIGGTSDVQTNQKPLGHPSPAKTKTAKKEQPKDTKPSKPAGPGTFEVDEQSAERALERSLNVSGALLLPAWSVELQPFFSYSRSETVGESQVFGNEDAVFADRTKINQNNFRLGLTTRIGLPFDSQLELTFPYRYNEITKESSITEIASTDSAFEAGDLSIGIAKTLLREKNWWPDVIGRITWDTATGKTVAGDVFIEDGIHELQFSFTALKRLDPLALFGTVSYQTAFESKNALFGDDYKPGDQYTIFLGVSLATSPETSLSAALQTAHSEKDERNGHRIFGTNQLASSLVFGASWVVGRGSLISFSPAIGLTDDAADFSASLSWSYRLR